MKAPARRSPGPADERLRSPFLTGMWLLSPMTMSSCLLSWTRAESRRRS